MKYYFSIALLLLTDFCLAQFIPRPEITMVSIDLYTGETFVHWEEVDIDHATYYFVTRREYNSSNPSWPYQFLNGVDPEPVIKGTQNFTSFDDPWVDDSTVAYQMWLCTDELHIDCSEIKQEEYEQSIFLSGSFDSCQAKVKLNWNDFRTWDQQLTKYYIYSTTDSVYSTDNLIEPRLEGVFNPGTNTAELPVNNPQSNITYFVAAKKTVTGDSATSNAILLSTEMARIPDTINADYASWSEGGIDMQFTISPESGLNHFRILRSDKTEGSYYAIDSVFTRESTISYIDKAPYLNGPYYYKLNAINYCLTPVKISNAASTILLNASLEEKNMQLSWNDYYQWRAGIEKYTVYRKFGNNDFTSIAEVQSPNYTDDLSLAAEDENNQLVCYYITANENPHNHLGDQGNSLSNQICMELSPNIRFEFNAFTPGHDDGNDSFGPAMDFTPSDYVFQIFSQAGSMLYESINPSETRWDGLINGEPAPSGAYMYIVQYKLNGKKETISGMVSIVY